MDIVFALICTEEELSIEELDPDDGEDELKEQIDNEDVEDILQREQATPLDEGCKKIICSIITNVILFQRRNEGVVR